MLQTKIGSHRKKTKQEEKVVLLTILTVDDVVQCLNNLNKSSYVKKNLY